MNNQVNKYFVVGTDTGVGKTVLSLLMMRFFYERGDIPFYIKPLQTGCMDPYDTDSDAKLIYQNVAALKGEDPADSVIYCFRNPKAPYFAARDEGRAGDIDIKVIQNFVEKKARSFNPVVLEGAGGLFVPVDGNTWVVDLIGLTGSRAVVVARAGLGTINHTLLTLEALQRKKIDPLGVVFIDSQENATTQDMIYENIEAVEKASGVSVAGVIGRVADFSNLGREHNRVLKRLFDSREF